MTARQMVCAMYVWLVIAVVIVVLAFCGVGDWTNAWVGVIGALIISTVFNVGSSIMKFLEREERLDRLLRDAKERHR